MTQQEPDNVLKKLAIDYCNKKGYDINKLDKLTEKEYNELLSDLQIDAYIKGKLVGEQNETNNATVS